MQTIAYILKGLRITVNVEVTDTLLTLQFFYFTNRSYLENNPIL